mgnify:CR=1 FL=1
MVVQHYTEGEATYEEILNIFMEKLEAKRLLFYVNFNTIK